jgi:putative transposase
MTQGLKWYQFAGDLHFVTFSCNQQQPYLALPSVNWSFEQAFERVRIRYELYAIGNVVMPGHVHLLLSEPPGAPLSKALHSLKSSVAKLSTQRPLWLASDYDFNVYTARKRVEKLRYMHRNPLEARVGETAGRLAMDELLPLRRGKTGTCRDWILFDRSFARKEMVLDGKAIKINNKLSL